ncbi:MAG: glycosyltransferase family 2 protein [Candidatus Omnitrophica bacterium]|nr:glycosyltransferase family 2 protein [Candidatus Omnitrophota bacterium]MDD5488519.1 glycosyltransferase family 2 protein [Candidatus Omnitrophota bacterium]
MENSKEFRFSPTGLAGRQRVWQRVFEIMPGAVSWGIICGMTVLSAFFPLVAAILIIAFYIYWLLRIFYLTIFLVLSYLRLSVEKDTDWMDRVRNTDKIKDDMGSWPKKGRSGSRAKDISEKFYRKDVENLIRSRGKKIHSDDIYHIVIVPIAKESGEIVNPGIMSMTKSKFPTSRILLVMALEARAEEQVKRDIREIGRRYKDLFLDVLIVEHPDGIPGEIRAKGANTTFAARAGKEFFSERNIPLENVLVSCFDSDTVVNEQYFACLTYYFLVCPFRCKASFQPIPVYNNNIWDAPGLTRVLDIGSSFFLLIEATNPEKLVTFSSHSMSFQALCDIGYWPVDMISDDSAVFWKAFLQFNGEYHTVPMYTTISMDAVVGESLWKTVVNVYKQKRRWAWGVENFPIVMRGFMQNRGIPLLTKIKQSFKLLEGHVSWSTWAFLLTFVGWLPAALSLDKEFAVSVFYYSGPRVAATIFNLASFSLIASIILSFCMLPRRGKKVSLLKKAGFILQWLLMPFTLIFLSALPALDAQTRLMTGRYMGFWVTDKIKSGKS